MSDDVAPRESTDRLLLAEIALGLLFFALLLGLYLVPAATEWSFSPGAWRWLVLAAVLFLLLALEGVRRRLAPKEAVSTLMRGYAARRGGRRPASGKRSDPHETE